MTANTLLLSLGTLTLDLNNPDMTGFIISSVDLGAPAVRAVTTDLPGQDGADDQTAYFSTRSVQLTGALVPTVKGASRSAAFDSLAPFISPGARPTLTYSLDEDTALRTLDLRVGQWTNPIDHPTNATGFSVQWVCPDPIAYGQSVNEVNVPFATGSNAGRTYPRIYPLSYPAGVGPSGETLVTTAGTYSSWPTLRIFGPCADPKVYWLDPVTTNNLGIQVAFTGLTIAGGDYVEVNTKARTAFLNGSPGSSRYSFIDFANTSWAPLAAGANLLRFAPYSASTGCVCEVLWNDSYL